MIEVIKPGMYSSIQDSGRFGYRSSGVPISGVMDRTSAFNANRIVGNPLDMAVVEFTGPGPTLKFLENAMIAISGANVDLNLNDIAIEPNKRIRVDSGSILSAGNSNQGVWAYLAILGGIDSEVVLGSRSMYKNITPTWRLTKGMRLDISNDQYLSEEQNIAEVLTEVPKGNDIEVYKGPEFDALSETDIIKLLGTEFVVSHQSNRMAYLLDHDLTISANEIITSVVQPGTIQLTPSGKLIVLMRDAQTTGGYARIFQLTEMAINKIAQRKAGTKVQFRVI